jgi:hypothetical protein
MFVDERQLFLSRVAQLRTLLMYRGGKTADIPAQCRRFGLRHVIAPLLFPFAE